MQSYDKDIELVQQKAKYNFVKNMEKFTRKIKVKNKLGIHARPAAILSDIAQKANKGAKIFKDNKSADMQSTIEILSLNCVGGSEVMIEVYDSCDLHILDKIEKIFIQDDNIK